MKKTDKLVERLEELTSSEQKKSKLDSLKALLEKLKKRQKKLEGQLEGASGGKERRLKREIKVIKAQRKKGLERYKELGGDKS